MRVVILALPEHRASALALARSQQARDVQILLIDNATQPPLYDRYGDIRIQQGISLRPIPWLKHTANRVASLNKTMSRWFSRRAHQRSSSRLEAAWKAELAFLRADHIVKVGNGLPKWAIAAASQPGSPSRA